MTEEQIIVQINPDVPPTGSDLGITNAARRSFGKRSEWDIVTSNDVYYDFDSKTMKGEVTQELVLKDKDKRLLEFLARGMTANDFEQFLESVSASGAWNSGYLSSEGGNKVELIGLLWEWRNTPTHDTPFSHSFFSFEVKAPIFVARHLVKHEYLIMSEYSRRYITDDVEFYEPDVWRKQSSDVKQGSSGEVTTSCVLDDDGEYTHPKFLNDDVNTYCLRAYNEMVGAGVAIEQARMVLPQSLMTAWTWSGTLGAFANMCKLRLSKDTQAETRYVAEKVYEELKKQFPIAAPLLVEGVY